MINSLAQDGQRNCPICGTGSLTPCGDESWSFWGVDYTLLQCASCGSATTYPAPDDATVERVYRESFDYRWYRDHYAAKLSDARTRIAEHGERLGRRVIDFGGGLGYFSEAAKACGHDSMTLDSFAGSKGGGSAPADTVVALHVLEHANDLDRAMSSICGLLRPNGHLLVAVPNYRGAGYRRWGMRWVWAQPPLIHIHHFTATGLRCLLERHGIGDCHISYHDRWDANHVADVTGAEAFRRRDAAWGLWPWCRFAIYRKWVARRNAALRNLALNQSLNIDMPAEDRAELEIYGRYEGGQP